MKGFIFLLIFIILAEGCLIYFSTNFFSKYTFSTPISTKTVDKIVYSRGMLSEQQCYEMAVNIFSHESNFSNFTGKNEVRFREALEDEMTYIDCSTLIFFFAFPESV